ncbi:MAG: polyprenyl synthetase family protein [Gammaproteobacteria bacterium SHHR-1]|uniref:polyprenyl synthetase family protein n=1 Tax=Magnetovirga frankeli TaxID=947516 RepID=UPI00129385D7|nr:polyprenyl synthetase family protein [gamma proteobacterium SS-5]
MTPEAFAVYARRCRLRVEGCLDRLLPTADHLPERLHRAMRYAALAPGKRVRPLLVYATGDALGCAHERLDGIAAAVEMIHAFSLVHDDLPAMDDDALRRGQATCHMAFDEASAILAGDALQTEAFLVLAQQDGGIDPQLRLQMIELLAQAAGSRGMAGGQALDMAAENQELDLPQLEIIHIHKTGALIRAAVNMACLASRCDPEPQRRLDHYAKCVGLAFQIRDDILDVEGETQTLGKTQGKDSHSNKATYPALLGLQGAHAKAQELIDEALHSLTELDQRADPLRALASYILRRIS